MTNIIGKSHPTVLIIWPKYTNADKQYQIIFAQKFNGFIQAVALTDSRRSHV